MRAHEGETRNGEFSVVMSLPYKSNYTVYAYIVKHNYVLGEFSNYQLNAQFFYFSTIYMLP